tara:strand:- start:6251 stop:7687 length:1437 start_codon:yes stop_codon:yes gene_type:complete
VVSQAKADDGLYKKIWDYPLGSAELERKVFTPFRSTGCLQGKAIKVACMSKHIVSLGIKNRYIPADASPELQQAYVYLSLTKSGVVNPKTGQIPESITINFFDVIRRGWGWWLPTQPDPAVVSKIIALNAAAKDLAEQAQAGRNVSRELRMVESVVAETGAGKTNPVLQQELAALRADLAAIKGGKVSSDFWSKIDQRMQAISTKGLEALWSEYRTQTAEYERRFGQLDESLVKLANEVVMNRETLVEFSERLQQQDEQIAKMATAASVAEMEKGMQELREELDQVSTSSGASIWWWLPLLLLALMMICIVVYLYNLAAKGKSAEQREEYRLQKLVRENASKTDNLLKAINGEQTRHGTQLIKIEEQLRGEKTHFPPSVGFAAATTSGSVESASESEAEDAKDESEAVESDDSSLEAAAPTDDESVDQTSDDDSLESAELAEDELEDDSPSLSVVPDRDEGESKFDIPLYLRRKGPAS